MVPAFAAATFGDDQPCLLQHLQMLHHRAAVEIGEMVAQRPRRKRLILQIVQNLTSNAVRERLEDAVEIVVD
jgi:hypothetical protein